MLHVVTPAWLFGLLALPLLALVHWQTVQREREALEDFAGPDALAKMDVRPAAEVRLWRGLAVIGALACMLVALAQPRWGGAGAEAGAQPGSIVVVLDVSKSMRVRDVGGDSRLKAAQLLVHDLLPQMAGWRVGLVAFAGEAEVLCPLTTDHEAVRTLMARARTGGVPGKGTDVEAGLAAAAKLFRQPGPRAVVLLSDGEALSGDAQAGVAALKGAKATLWSVGMGTAEGGRVPAETTAWGDTTDMTWRGEPVVSKLDASALTALAEAADGGYLKGGDPATEPALAQDLGLRQATPQAQVAAAAGAVGGAAYELFQIPLALALLLIAFEGVLAVAGRPRRVTRFADVLKAMRARPAAMAALWIMVALTQGAWTWYPVWLPNGEAGEAYQGGDLARAEKILRDALAHDPDNFRLRYNLGNVLHERGNFDAAAKVYESALRNSDDATRPAVRYNLGNTHFRQAEKSGDVKGYERAIADYEAVLKARPDDKEAADNLALAKERLSRKKGQKPQSGNSGGTGGSGGQGTGPTPVGVRTRYKPPPLQKDLPRPEEVDSLLRALETDERQRQAEQAMEQPEDNGMPDARNMLEQALGGLGDDKDW